MDKKLIRIGRLENMKDTRPVDLSHDGVPLTVVRAGDEVNAFARVCSHSDRVFNQTKMKNGCIFCPYHGGRVCFDGRTGGVVNRDGKDVPEGLHKLDTLIVDGVVYVRLHERDFDFMVGTARRRAEREELARLKSKKKGLFDSISRLLGGK